MNDHIRAAAIIRGSSQLKLSEYILKLKANNFLSRSFFTLVLICACSIGGLTQVPPTNTPSNAGDQNERYRIGFQDVITVQVFKHGELSQRVPVNPNGTISLFRLEKPVIAVCRTEMELADDIAAAYKVKYLRDPQVVVVAEQKSQPISVIGAVEKPGNYFLTRRVHLLEMLSIAGGPNKEAGTRLIIARAGTSSNCRQASDGEPENVTISDFRVRDIQEGKKIFWMQPGDVVSVLDADIVYVYGNVNKQGAYKVREPITLTQAIVSAEGLKPAARRDKVRILRQVAGNNDRTEIVIDLGMVDKGKAKDPILEPNDIVAVSEDKTKSILLGIASTMKNAAPNILYRFP